LDLTYLSVCSGIEAATVAWHPLGWRPLAFSEIEKFPCAVLAHHYPDVPNLGDMTTMDVAPLGRIDLLVGGTPCQAFSVAGLRQSLDDARGNLTLSYVRLAHELVEEHGLRNSVWENVPGVLSTKDNAFGCFLGALVGSDEPLVPSPKPADGKSDAHWKWSKGRHSLKWPNSGMVSGPEGRAAWTIKDAQYFGLAQRRRRVFVVSDFGNGADPAAVLFELEGVPGNPAPRREPGKDVAPTISARPTVGGGLGTDFDLDGGLIPSKWPAEIASTLNAHYGDKWGLEDQHALGGAALFVPAQTVALRGREGGGTAELGGDIATALRASQGGGDKPHVLTHAFDARQTDVIQYGDVTGPVDTKQPSATALIGSAVRRLTPMECERLQGFQDNYTRIPMPKSGKKVGPVWAADGPRYKALGNSMAVPVMHWIGARIDRLMPREQGVPRKQRFNFGRLT